jgi:hypothetical protein
MIKSQNKPLRYCTKYLVDRKVTVDQFSDFALKPLFSTVHQLVKGQKFTIGQILADFVASCIGKIVEILTQMGRRNELISQEPMMIQRWGLVSK